MIIELVILFLGYILVGILGIAIKIILKNYSSKIENSGIKGAGTLIGVFERILVFTFVLTNQYAAISIIFAAKSIARFSELNNRDFAEYYLLGTFLSITVALMVGIVFKLLFANISI